MKKCLVEQLKLCYPCESLFFELTKDLVVKEDRKEYPDSIFWFNDDKYIFDYNEKNGFFWCSWSNYWSKFEKKFDFNYYQIRYLTKDMVEEHFKLKGITSVKFQTFYGSLVEEHFKLKGITSN